MCDLRTVINAVLAIIVAVAIEDLHQGGT